MFNANGDKKGIAPCNDSIRAAAVTVDSTAGGTALYSTSNLVGREAIAIKNNGAVTLYLGPSGVTSTTGYPLAAGESLVIELGPDVTIYGIAASSCNVRILEVA